MELRAYARLMATRWLLILAALLVVVIATMALTFTQTPTYLTTTTFVVSPSASLKDVNSVLQGLDTLSRQNVDETYNNVVTSRAVVDAAAAELGLSPAELKRYKVTSDVAQNANILTISVEGPDPVRAAALANHVGAQSVRYVQGLYEAYDLKPLDAAVAPKDPVSPNKMANLLLSIIVGLGLGVALAFIAEYTSVPADNLVDNSILDPETGVYNRVYFMQRLNQELSRSKRQNYPLSIGLMHIENLDAIRGAYPSRTRAEALRQVAVYLKQYLRPEDLIARVGGDQFAFLFPDTPGSTAKEILERLQARIDGTVFELGSSGVKLNLSSSSGVMAPSNGAGPDELLAKAEQAMRRAGTNGYNKIYLWQESEGHAA